MAIYFPESIKPEIKNWLEIHPHEHDPNMAQQEGAEAFGEKVGEPMRLVAPQSIVENNQQNYSSADFKLSTAAAAMIEGEGAGWWETTAAAGMMAANQLFAGAAQEIARGSSQVVNPRSEQLYTAPGYRTWTFHWELAPLTAGDSSTLTTIIKNIRRSSYPELAGAAGMLYQMPHEFKLTLIADKGGAKEAQDPKFGKCVCTNVGVNYTGAGVNVISTASNSPFINLDMTFVERILLHQGSEPIA